MLEKRSGALIAVKAFGAIRQYLRYDTAPLGPRPGFSQAVPDQWTVISASIGAARLGLCAPDAFNCHIGKSHASRAFYELRTLRTHRAYPFQEGGPADHEQHRAICGRRLRALRFELMIFGPKEFAHGCFEGGAR